MNKQEIAEIQSLFDSIVCLAVEGPEFHTKLELMDAIRKEAIKGYDLCKRHLTSQSSGHDDRCHCWAFPATDCNEFKGGKCLLRCR